MDERAGEYPAMGYCPVHGQPGARGAKQEAAARGIGLIRVDCWAGENGSLVRVYEKYGFSRAGEFTVTLSAGDWPGMLLAMRLAADGGRQEPAIGTI